MNKKLTTLCFILVLTLNLSPIVYGATQEETGDGYQIIELIDSATSEAFATDKFMKNPNGQNIFIAEERAWMVIHNTSNGELDFHSAPLTDLTDWEIEYSQLSFYGDGFYSVEFDQNYVYLAYNTGSYYIFKRGTLESDGTITLGSAEDMFSISGYVPYNPDLCYSTSTRHKFIVAELLQQSTSKITAGIELSDQGGGGWRTNPASNIEEFNQDSNDDDLDTSRSDVCRYDNSSNYVAYTTWYNDGVGRYLTGVVSNWTSSPRPHDIAYTWEHNVSVRKPYNARSFSTLSNDFESMAYTLIGNDANNVWLVVEDLEAQTSTDYLIDDNGNAIAENGIGLMRYYYEGYDNIYCFWIDLESTVSYLRMKIYRNGVVSDVVNIANYTSSEELIKMNVAREITQYELDQDVYSNPMGFMSYLRLDNDSSDYDLLGYFWELPLGDESPLYPFFEDDDTELISYVDEYFNLSIGIFGFLLMTYAGARTAIKYRKTGVSEETLQSFGLGLVAFIIGYGLVVVWLSQYAS